MNELEDSAEQGPLPRTREAVDWWLKKWGRQAVLDGKEPLTREDVERLIEVNGGTAEGLILSRRDLSRSSLLGINLERARLQKANLQDSTLDLANLESAVLEDTNLQGANLFCTNLQDAWLSGIICDKETKLVGAQLQGAKLVGVNLQNVDLSGADLSGAVLRESDLQGANLAGARISPGTNLERVKWDKNYINVLERRGEYEAAIPIYRRLKEWYRGAGMLKIAGEFHYREEEAITKAQGQQLWSEFKQIGNDFREFKRSLKTAWQQLKGMDADTRLKK